MESLPQNPEFRNNPENFHPWWQQTLNNTTNLKLIVESYIDPECLRKWHEVFIIKDKQSVMCIYFVFIKNKKKTWCQYNLYTNKKLLRNS